jgi:hypothetical protein
VTPPKFAEFHMSRLRGDDTSVSHHVSSDVRLSPRNAVAFGNPRSETRANQRSFFVGSDRVSVTWVDVNPSRSSSAR